MASIWLHRYSVFVAVMTLFLVVAGASVTSNDAGLAVPDWPLSFGKVMPAMTGGIFYEHGHRMIATTVGLLTIVLAVWIWRADRRRWLRRLGLAAMGLVVLQGVLGGVTVLLLLPKAVSIGHACLAQVFFSVTVAIAVFTSPSWRQQAQAPTEAAAPSIRFLALLCPVAVLAQTALGAAYRHQALGLVPHVAGAMAVAGIVLAGGVLVLLHCRAHAALRRSALALMHATFLQVFLGVAAYMSLVAAGESLQPQALMVWLTVLHVAMGAIVMASSVVLAIQVLRNVRTEPVMSQGGVAVAS